jgi:multidrug efflux pump subunit AcrB
VEVDRGQSQGQFVKRIWLEPTVKIHPSVDLAIRKFEAVLIGVGLAGVVLLLFLRDFKITIITLIVVPAVLASTVLLLAVLGMSFNIMTLGGMAAAIGLIIDDAIVIIEQIERRLHSTGEKGHAEIRAATWEFLQPLAGSSAATIIIFVPLAFLTGVTGAFFKALSLTLAASLIISFMAAFFAIPLMADYFITAKEAKHQEHQGPIFRRVLSVYRKTFNGLLAFPMLALPVVAAFLAVGYLAYTQVGSGFMPVMDEGGFVFDYISPPGASLEDTDAMLQQVEKILRATPEVATYSRRSGLQLGGALTEANVGDIFVRLKPPPRRNIEEIIRCEGVITAAGNAAAARGGRERSAYKPRIAPRWRRCCSAGGSNRR